MMSFYDKCRRLHDQNRTIKIKLFRFVSRPFTTWPQKTSVDHLRTSIFACNDTSLTLLLKDFKIDCIYSFFFFILFLLFHFHFIFRQFSHSLESQHFERNENEPKYDLQIIKISLCMFSPLYHFLVYHQQRKQNKEKEK